jgi:hypothetical protein
MDFVKPLTDWFFSRDPAAFFAGVSLGLVAGYLLYSTHVKNLIAIYKQEIKQLGANVRVRDRRIKALRQKNKDLEQMLRDSENERDALLQRLGQPKAVAGDSQKALEKGRTQTGSSLTQLPPGPEQTAVGERDLRERLVQAYQQKGGAKDLDESFVETITRAPFDTQLFRVWTRHGERTPVYIRHKGTSLNHRVEVPGGDRVLAPIRQLEELNSI